MNEFNTNIIHVSDAMIAKRNEVSASKAPGEGLNDEDLMVIQQAGRDMASKMIKTSAKDSPTQ